MKSPRMDHNDMNVSTASINFLWGLAARELNKKPSTLWVSPEVYPSLFIPFTVNGMASVLYKYAEGLELRPEISFELPRHAWSVGWEDDFGCGSVEPK